LVNLAYLTVIIVTHLAFAGVFGFLFWQKRSRFARALTIAWFLQILRIEPLLARELGWDVWELEWGLADAIYPFAILCLLTGCFDLLGERISRRLAVIYVTSAVLVVLASELFGTFAIGALTGMPQGQAEFWSIFLRQLLLFGSAAAAASWLATRFYLYWRSSGLPGALIACVGALPFAVGNLLVPFQWYFAFYPWQSHLFWFLQVLALSTGLLVLVLNEDHAALQNTLARLRTLRGLLPICACCKRIRDDEGYWLEIEAYVRDHSEAEFTHGLCPQCMSRMYPEFSDPSVLQNPK
jgi:hypothetical protein